MNTEYLDQSERASTRAQIYMESGAFNEARKAFVEAADAMLRFSEAVQGKQKANAQQIAELLLKKAKLAKEKADGESRPVAPAAPATPPEPAVPAEPAVPPAPPEPVTPPAPATPAEPVTPPAEPVIPPPPAPPERPIPGLDSSGRPMPAKPVPGSEAEKADKPKTPEKPKNDNRTAITRDLQSYQRNAAGKGSFGGEDRLKFTPVESPNVHFSDIAGLESVKSAIQMKVIQPILHPEIYERFSKSSNGGILLYGPPGTGKTMIARAIATETNLAFFSVRCSDIVGKTFGDGERNLKALFEAARENGRAMIFFDEFESLAPRRGGGSTIMNRIVPELLSQMDGFQKAEGTLIVLASTNRPWDLDSAVLRPPRMTERIYVGLPDQAAREYIVKKELDPLPKEETPDYSAIAEALEGYNCADIIAFTEKVKEAPIRRGLENPGVEQFITEDDIAEALISSHSSVQKSDLEAFSKWEGTQR